MTTKNNNECCKRCLQILQTGQYGGVLPECKSDACECHTNKDWAHNDRAAELWDYIRAAELWDYIVSTAEHGIEIQNAIREFIQIARQDARAQMAQEVVAILRAQIPKTNNREALLALEVVERAVTTSNCTCASFFTVRGVHKKDCSAKVLAANNETNKE